MNRAFLRKRGGGGGWWRWGGVMGGGTNETPNRHVRRNHRGIQTSWRAR